MIEGKLTVIDDVGAVATGETRLSVMEGKAPSVGIVTPRHSCTRASRTMKRANISVFEVLMS